MVQRRGRTTTESKGGYAKGAHNKWESISWYDEGKNYPFPRYENNAYVIDQYGERKINGRTVDRYNVDIESIDPTIRIVNKNDNDPYISVIDDRSKLKIRETREANLHGKDASYRQAVAERNFLRNQSLIADAKSEAFIKRDSIAATKLANSPVMDGYERKYYIDNSDTYKYKRKDGSTFNLGATGTYSSEQVSRDEFLKRRPWRNGVNTREYRDDNGKTHTGWAIIDQPVAPSKLNSKPTPNVSSKKDVKSGATIKTPPARRPRPTEEYPAGIPRKLSATQTKNSIKGQQGTKPKTSGTKTRSVGNTSFTHKTYSKTNNATKSRVSRTVIRKKR